MGCYRPGWSAPALEVGAAGPAGLSGTGPEAEGDWSRRSGSGGGTPHGSIAC